MVTLKSELKWLISEKGCTEAHNKMHHFNSESWQAVLSESKNENVELELRSLKTEKY